MTKQQQRELLNATRTLVDLYLYSHEDIPLEFERQLLLLQEIVEEIEIENADDYEDA